MSGLKFTDEAAQQLEKTYRAKDMVAQRLETIRHLNLSGGESVLDIGCGPGFLCESMCEIVGREKMSFSKIDEPILSSGDLVWIRRARVV